MYMYLEIVVCYLEEVLLLPDDGGLQGGRILGGDLILEVPDRATQVIVVLPELFRHLQSVLQVSTATGGQLADVVVQTHQLRQLCLHICKQSKLFINNCYFSPSLIRSSFAFTSV